MGSMGAKLTGDPILIDLARLRVAMVSAQGWQIDPREFVGETRRCADAGVAVGEPGIAARALLMEAVAAYEALQRAAMCAEAGRRAAALAAESGDGWLVGVADAVQVSGILRTNGPIDELLARADSIVSRYGRLHRMAYLQNAAFLLAQQGKADSAFAYIDELEASRLELRRRRSATRTTSTGCERFSGCPPGTLNRRCRCSSAHSRQCASSMPLVSRRPWRASSGGGTGSPVTPPRRSQAPNRRGR